MFVFYFEYVDSIDLIHFYK